jgi:hypothetical protein
MEGKNGGIEVTATLTLFYVVDVFTVLVLRCFYKDF